MISISRNGVAGSYVGVRQGTRLELRVDVGRPESLDVLSGDIFFETSPGSFEFHHSFQTTTLVLEEEAGVQILRGPVKVHRDDIVNIGRVDLRIPQQGDLVATYTLYRLTQVGRQTAAEFSFSVQSTSEFFRRVDLELESVRGVSFPRPFRTSDHPDTPVDQQGQTLTLASVYRAAGVDLNVTLGGEEIPVSEAGSDGLWTNEELHAAMVNHFDQHRDEPQWRLYLLLATKYVSPSVLGIMFDAAEDDDFHRQGAAVFHDHDNIANATGAEKDREYLFTIVHEVGHAFNFLHSFQKGIFETHGVLPRPDAMSWMNYPQLFPFGFAGPTGWDGTNQFWPQFRFRFDPDEIHHIRHDDRSEVIAGGRSFGFAGHLEERPFSIPNRTPDLSLHLWTPPVVDFLQQVEADVRLRNESGIAVEIPPSLDPAAGYLEIVIRRPTDRFPKVYRHFANACMRGASQGLAPGEALYQEIFPSYGSRHWFIDEPGTYELQAVLKTPNGGRVASNVQRIRVLNPDQETDRLAADFYTDDAGVYLGVEGSRCPRLDKARAMLEELCHRIPTSKIAQQIRMTNSLRDTRVFKDVGSGKVVRPDRSKAAADYLKAVGVSDANKVLKVDESLSNLRVTRALRAAAQGCVAENNQADAKRIMELSGRFMTSVKAPTSAQKETESFAKSLGL